MCCWGAAPAETFCHPPAVCTVAARPRLTQGARSVLDWMVSRSSEVVRPGGGRGHQRAEAPNGAAAYAAAPFVRRSGGGGRDDPRIFRHEAGVYLLRREDVSVLLGLFRRI